MRQEQQELEKASLAAGRADNDAEATRVELLLVAHNEARARCLRAAFASAPTCWTIHQAGSCEAAVSLCARIEPQCVIVFHDAPGCDGLELLSLLEQRGLLVESPVVLVSADESLQLGVSAMKAGATDVISSRGLSELVLTRAVADALAERQRSAQMARHIYAEKLASLSQLVSGAAHEINNPAAIARLTLSAVGEAIKRAQSGAPLDDVERLQTLIQAADDALGRIGLVVRELERQTGSALGHIHALSLDQVVHAARPTIERLMHGGGDVRFLCASEATFPGDAAQLSRVVVDLVENALEATAGVGRVEVTTRSLEHLAELTVDDDGPGVDIELRERIFEPLYTTHRERGALGMGLARASAIVERHGGSLTVERSPQGGARLTLRIPLARSPHGSLAAPDAA